MTRPSERSLGIDLLRVISITLVVLSHYEVSRGFILGGTHGVVLFFMVSGYCMHYSTRGRTGLQFLLARFWRLVPTLVVCATLTTLIEFATPGARPDRLHTFNDYLANVACLWSGNLICDVPHALRHGTARYYSWVDGAYWSLLVEIRFYLLLWLLTYVLGLRQVPAALVLLGAFALLEPSTALLSKSNDFLLYLPFFAFGMAYRSWIEGEAVSRLVMLAAFGLFALECQVGTSTISMSLTAANFSSYALCFAIFLAVMTMLRDGWNATVSYLGLLSYPLYLLHQDIGLALIEVVRPAFGSALAITSTALAVLSMAAMVQHAVDATVGPLRRWLRATTGRVLQFLD